MNKMEYRIDAKIIEQLSLYFLSHDIYHFSIHFQATEAEVIFIVEVLRLSEHILDHLRTKLQQVRALEIEMYGWELMGDTDPMQVLDVLGSLIDAFAIEEHEAMHRLILKRKKAY